ncbi:MAG: hypothetical protein HC917_18010, partial [Richelia sp. SM2_1_7]|nr:hypothetical protein [Richelia sp. SM2_1_7]
SNYYELPPGFHAFGLIKGIVSKNENGETSLTIGSSSFFVTVPRHFDSFDVECFILVYPKFRLIPKEPPKLWFYTVKSFETEPNHTGGIPLKVGQFVLCGVWQFIPVVKAVNQVLAKTPAEQIIYRVSQLAEAPFDWNLVRFVSADLNEKLKSEAIRGIPFLPMKRRLQNRFSAEIRLDSLVCASAAGFWYLHEKKPAQAEEAFAVVRSILYGEEMYALAQNIAVFNHAKDFDDIAKIAVENLHTNSLKSSQEKLLRPTTWQAISKLHRVVEDAQLVKRSVSRATPCLCSQPRSRRTYQHPK